jgi:DNA-binding MarR family transcriptional regulator
MPARPAREPKRDESLDLAWSKLQPLFFSKRDAFFAAIAEHGLTPPHGQALVMLAHQPMRMRDIADNLVCDASYVTVIVDNLEHHGFAVRQPSATDRRVKEITLTDRGRAVAAEIHRHMTDPPDALRQLSVADRRALAHILAKLKLDRPDTPWPQAARRR